MPARAPCLQIRQNLEKNSYWQSLMQGLQSDDTQPKTLVSVTNILDRYQDLTVEVRMYFEMFFPPPFGHFLLGKTR